MAFTLWISKSWENSIIETLRIFWGKKKGGSYRSRDGKR